MRSDAWQSVLDVAQRGSHATWRTVTALGQRAVGLARRVGRWWVRDWRGRTRTVVLALVGALVGVTLAGHVTAKVGPFDATVALRPSLSSDTTVYLSPLGTIVLDTHDWPMAFDLHADQIGLDEAERIANDPRVIDTLGDDVADDVRVAVRRLAVRALAAAALGGLLGALAARLNWRAAMAGAGGGALVLVTLGGATAMSFNANAVSEPRYTGLLTAAPQAIGNVEAIVQRVDEYRTQLRDLVANVVTLYVTAENLPTFEPESGTIRVLHVSDIHLNPGAFDLIRQVTREFPVDAIVDTGDITDWGTEPETQLMSEIGDLDVPYVFVRGNHDSHRTQRAVADQPNAVVLDNDAERVAGLRFWGIGDPRYTPNKDQPVEDGDGQTEQEAAEAFAPDVAEHVAEAEQEGGEVDVVLVHDPRAAAELGGEVPLVLAGHTHDHEESRIEPTEDEEEQEEADGDEEPRGEEQGDQQQDDEGAEAEQSGEEGGDGGQADEADQPPETILLTEGSTGGAGLRGLQGQEPEPLTASLLYFDEDTRELLAYDHISVKGFGETGATIERHIIERPDDPDDPHDPDRLRLSR